MPSRHRGHRIASSLALLLLALQVAFVVGDGLTALRGVAGEISRVEAPGAAHFPRPHGDDCMVCQFVGHLRAPAPPAPGLPAVAQALGATPGDVATGRHAAPRAGSRQARAPPAV